MQSLSLAVALVAAASLAGAAPRGAAPASRASADLCGGYSYTHAGEAAQHGWGLSGSLP